MPGHRQEIPKPSTLWFRSVSQLTGRRASHRTTTHACAARPDMMVGQGQMTHSSTASAVSAGQVIAGRYQLLTLLGRGGLCHVYKVLDNVTGRTLALKRLDSGAAQTVQELFELEYQTLVSLNHPGIVRVYDYEVSADGTYYTMELLQGGDLSQSAPRPWREACAYLRDAASVLAVLHARQLVHRDVSPRNLWRCSDGRLKLLDFGALAPFGRSRALVGTVPFISPEAARGAELDQRSDLFALGALGYWLCTGAHAFGAQHASELARLHALPPAPPSRLLAAKSDGEDPLPPALDALLLALLKPDPNDRPQHASELIDRLNVLADLAPEEASGQAQGYIASKAFVGREQERSSFASMLQATKQPGARARVLLIEAEDAGVGRSHLLRELAVSARLRAVTAIDPAPEPGGAPLAAATSWATTLLNNMPRARELAAALDLPSTLVAPVVAAGSGAVVPDSAERSSRASLEPARSVVQERSEVAALSAAIGELLLQISREQTLCLFVDDLELLDEPSQVLLAKLAFDASPARLLIVATLRLNAVEAPPPALHRLRNLAQGLQLSALKEHETFLLLRSVFGSVPYLERLAQRVHQASAGNPAHCIEIAEHLAQAGIATYVDGAWTLPMDLDAASLPSRRQARLARLARLPAATRELASKLSLPHWGPLTAQHCQTLLERDPDATGQALSMLCGAGLLREVAGGYGFVHAEVQHELASKLTPDQVASAHRLLGAAILASAGDHPPTVLLASLHYLHAGEMDKGLELLTRASLPYERREIVADLRVITPMLEAAYDKLKKHAAPSHALATPVALLAIAGYYIDRRFGAYGEEALRIGDEVLRLDVYRRYRSRIGRPLALLAALASSHFCARAHRLYAAPVPAAVARFVGVASALTALAATAADVPLATHYADALEPFTALGRKHVATFSYDFAQFVARQSSDHLAKHYRDALALRARLLSTAPPRGLLPPLKESYLSGINVMIMLLESWRESPESLVLADGLESVSALHKLYADAGRCNYHLRRGDVEQSELAQRRIELHAVELDSAWQIETWGGILENINLSLQTWDAGRMKRAIQDVTRLCDQLPSLKFLQRRARGHYEVMRGNYARGIALLDANEVPLADCGWAQTRGMLAHAYNAQSEHARAREVCLDALARLSAEDLDFVVMNLGVQIELALAEAGLGNTLQAAQALDALIATHAPLRGPLTLGSLHEARAKVALHAGDNDTCRVHLDRMTAYLHPVGLSSLRERIERLERRLRLDVHETVARSNETVELLTAALDRLRTQSTLTSFDCAQRCLDVALELTSAASGFIMLAGSEQHPVPHRGSELPTRDLLAWASERLHSEDNDEATIVELGQPHTMPNTWIEGQQTYLFSPLVTAHSGTSQLAGALVLGYNDKPRVPAARMLQTIAETLLRGANAHELEQP